jgi:hypothetical protein
VHLLVTVQNNKSCTVQRVKIKNTTVNVWVPSKSGNFLTSWETVRFSTRSRLHGVKIRMYRNVTSCSFVDVSRNFTDHIPNAWHIVPSMDLYIPRLGKEDHASRNSAPPSTYHTSPIPSFPILPAPVIKPLCSYGFPLGTAFWASYFRPRGDGKRI